MRPVAPGTLLARYLHALDSTAGGSIQPPPSVLRVLASKACRRAVMFGTSLSLDDRRAHAAPQTTHTACSTASAAPATRLQPQASRAARSLAAQPTHPARALAVRPPLPVRPWPTDAGAPRAPRRVADACRELKSKRHLGQPSNIPYKYVASRLAVKPYTVRVVMSRTRAFPIPWSLFHDT